MTFNREGHGCPDFLLGFVQVAGGRYHSLALKADGSIVTWGRDDYGQITDTPSGTGFAQVAGGGFHSLALLSHLSNETPLGERVVVQPLPEDEFGNPVDDAPAISLTFDLVTVSGDTSIVITENGPPPPGGLELIGIGGGTTYIDIETTATFDSFVEICINYSGFSPAVEPADLSLAHIVDGIWVDITTSNDMFHSVLCGLTPSFSFFAIVQAADSMGLLTSLNAVVNELDAQPGIKVSLLNMLAKTEGFLEDGHTVSAACVLINKFIPHVQKFSGKHISETEANDLVHRATDLANVLLF